MGRSSLNWDIDVKPIAIKYIKKGKSQKDLIQYFAKKQKNIDRGNLSKKWKIWLEDTESKPKDKKKYNKNTTKVQQNTTKKQDNQDKKKATKSKKPVDDTKIIQSYFTEKNNKSDEKFANENNINRQTLANILDRHGIKITEAKKLRKEFNNNLTELFIEEYGDVLFSLSEGFVAKEVEFVLNDVNIWHFYQDHINETINDPNISKEDKIKEVKGYIYAKKGVVSPADSLLKINEALKSFDFRDNNQVIEIDINQTIEDQNFKEIEAEVELRLQENNRYEYINETTE